MFHDLVSAEVKLSGPERLFKPGQSIQGTVSIHSAKSIIISDLKLKLIGKSVIERTRETNIYKFLDIEIPVTFDSIKEDISTVKSNQSKSDSSKTEPKRSFFTSKTLRSLDQITKIIKQNLEEKCDQRVVPFEVEIPTKHLPSSVDVGRNSITYCINADIKYFKADADNKIMSFRSTKSIQVLDIININSICSPQNYMVALPQNLASDRNGPNPKLAIKMLRSAFLRGENIDISIEISNTKALEDEIAATFTLYRLARFWRGDSCEVFRKNLAQTILPIQISRDGVVHTLEPRLHVPYDIIPTVFKIKNCEYIYYIEAFFNFNSNRKPMSKVPQNVKRQLLSRESEFVLTDHLRGTENTQTIDIEILIGTQKITPTGEFEEEETSKSETESVCLESEKKQKGQCSNAASDMVESALLAEDPPFFLNECCSMKDKKSDYNYRRTDEACSELQRLVSEPPL